MYIEHPINFTKEQLKKLIKGISIQFKPHELNGSGAKTIHLTRGQHKKLTHALTHGKGMRVCMEHPDQMRHNMIHGAGWREIMDNLTRNFSGGDIWGDIGNAFNPQTNGVAQAFNPQTNGVAQAVTQTFNPALGRELTSIVKPWVRPVIKTGVSSGIGYMTGVPFAGTAISPLTDMGVNKAMDEINLGVGIGGKGSVRRGTGVKGRRGKGIDEYIIKSLLGAAGTPYEIMGINPGTLGYDFGHDVVAPQMFKVLPPERVHSWFKGKEPEKPRPVRKGKGWREDIQPVVHSGLYGRYGNQGKGLFDEKFSVNEAKDFINNDVRNLFGGKVKRTRKASGLFDEKFSVNDAKNFINNDVKNLFGGKVKRGKGTRLLDQKFSVNEAKDFINNDVKNLFGGKVKKNKGKGMPDWLKKTIGVPQYIVNGVMTTVKPPMNVMGEMVNQFGQVIDQYGQLKDQKYRVMNGRGRGRPRKAGALFPAGY